MKKISYYVIPFLTLSTIVVIYCFDWNDFDVNDISNPVLLLIGVMAVFLLLVAWLFIPVHVVRLVLCLKRQDNDWKHHLIAAILVIGIYLGLAITIVIAKLIEIGRM
jgi:hypothetical protein